MNTRQLQYAVLLAETGNYSVLADKLNISQPALSKQILALEKELGLQLFDRGTSPITPTAAGAYFIRQAKSLLYDQEQLLHAMSQFKDGEKGQLVIGATPFRSAYLLPELIKKLRDKFPGIQVKVVEEGSALLRKDTADGKFDFAIINLPVDDAVLEATPIEPDRLAVVIPNSLLEQYPHLQGQQQVDFQACRELPFVVVSPQQEMRILFEKLCLRTGSSPNIAAEVVGLTTAWEMACSGVAATMLPMQYVSRKIHNAPVTVIELNDRTELRQPAIVVKYGQFISQFAQYAIDLLKMQ